MDISPSPVYPNIDPKLASSKASHFGVSPIIHPKDYLMHFLFFKSVIKNDENAVLNYYFGDAVNCSNNLTTVIDLAQRKLKSDKPEKLKLLEFASGYGRLTRHLISNPMFELSCCDIHDEAINFLEDTFSVSTFKSSLTPNEFKIQDKYDVVFALSFFSHIPKKYWQQWLQVLFDQVAPGGLLIFTTHGSTSQIKHFPNHEFDEDGFHFHSDTDQEDIDSEFYGTTITLPSFVQNQLNYEMKLDVFIEGFWWGHQDVYVMRKQHNC